MKRNIFVLVGCLIIVTVVMLGSAFAEIRPQRPSVGIFVGGYDFDFFQSNEQNPVFGLRAGYDFTEQWGLEAAFDYIPFTSEINNDDVNAFMYRVEGLYYLMPQKRLVPFGAIGVGGISVDPSSETNSSGMIADYGIGAKYFLSDRYSLRGDVRHVIDFSETYFIHNNLEYTIGLTIHFGAKKAEPVKAAVVTPPPVYIDIDSDRDGVADKLDKCPNTPAGVSVGANGCPKKVTDGDSDGDGVIDSQDQCPNTPMGVKVDSKGCPVDSDMDGVADHMDKCPGTPVGTRVDAEGCPVDSDNDGVVNSQDKCPNTPAGVKVDANGCPLDSDGDGVADYLDKCPDTKPNTLVDDKGCALPQKVSITLKIEFETAKADIQSKYSNEIKKLADFMIKYPTTTVEIGGHTDNVGKEAMNAKLSVRRADAVKKYLVDNFGIEASRISAKGYGFSKPVAVNSTASGRQQNRRIEAVIDTVVRSQ